MKRIFFIVLIIIFNVLLSFSQTLLDAKKLYAEENYVEALPIFETQYKLKPNDASLNHWYAVSLYMTGGDLEEAEKCLQLAVKRKVYESNMYLGAIYTEWVQFEEAEKYFNEYEKHLTRKGWRSKAQQEQEAEALVRLTAHVKEMQKMRRMVSHTEDIQIVDSVIVPKDKFLSAYALSFSGGKTTYFNDIFDSNIAINSTVYINEKQTKMYYALPDTSGILGLHTMEYLIDHFGNEKRISKENFGLEGNLNNPFVMSDGVTIYFAAQDPENLGGYDLFITRYNLNNDTYLKPERLNMPFNSKANDYMMVIDEEKGVGWFASDRGMQEGYVCVYTFIPNSIVKVIQSEDAQYLVNRATISSIKDTWVDDVDYSNIIARARKKPVLKQEIQKDFEFVINDNATYYTLDDFKNINARDAYSRVVQMRAEVAVISDRLELERDKYIDASAAKMSIASTILGLEDQKKQIEKEIPSLEINVRNLEIMELGRVRR